MKHNYAPYFTTARFNSICAETGNIINKGDTICIWNKKAYSDNSKHADELRGKQFNEAYCMADANY